MSNAGSTGRGTSTAQPFRIRAGVLLLAASLLALTAARARAQQMLPVDRWLVSSPFPADSASDALDKDYLAAPGEVAVLPDRGRTVFGADWKLMREDGAFAFRLPSDLALEAAVVDSAGDRVASTVRSGPVVAYAHAYIRATSDRTIKLMWGGLECTKVSAWLNGRRLDALGQPGGVLDGVPDAQVADVRIGFGYNTLLLKGASGDCDFGIAAGMEGTEEVLDGLRVQASRPYGDTRTGPESWVVAGADGGPEPMLGWKQDQLFGAAGARLAVFAVSPVDRVRIKARVGGQEIQREIEWLTPAEPRIILMPFPFERLRRAVLTGEGVELELDWGLGKSSTAAALSPESLLDGLHSSIRLLGWTVIGGGAEEPAARPNVVSIDDPDEAHPLAYLVPLPGEKGSVLLGEWKVPGWLSGFTLRLDVEGAPGAYRLNSLPAGGGEILLCRECRKGQTIRIEVTTTSSWERFPGAVIVDVARPATGGSGVEAAGWLNLLDEKGSREYRNRAAAAAGGN